MIEIGEIAVLRAVHRLADVAPVEVVYVPGNHDRIASYHLCRTLRGYFFNTKRVSVDIEPAVRKYRCYGSLLFGFRHGDQLPDNQVPSLPSLMACERPREWGETTTREWFLGHRHTSRAYSTRDSDEARGVQMRWIRPLTATDAWHHEQGYVGNTARLPRDTSIRLLMATLGTQSRWSVNARNKCCRPLQSVCGQLY